MAGVTWTRTRTPGVYKRPSARKPGENLYRVVYRDGTGRQVTRNFSRLADAETFKKGVDVNRPEDVAAGRIALRDVYSEMVASHAAAGEPYAPATLALHEQVWKHLAPLATEDIGKVTPTKVDAVLKAVPGASMRDKTRRVLSTVYAFAIAHRPPYVTVSPVRLERKRTTRTARMRHRAESGKGYRTLEPGELARLVGEMPERYRALVEVMAYQGLRPGEAVSLRVGDLDPLRRTLTIERSISGFTKTGSPRTLTLPPSVAELLVAHIASFSDPTDPNAPIFTTGHGGAIDTKNAYDAWARRVFGEAAKRAGITGDVTPNTLRHFAVTFAIGQGADVFAVQRMLGHARPSITLDVYGSEWETTAEELAAKLDGPIREARTERPTPGEVIAIR